MQTFALNPTFTNISFEHTKEWQNDESARSTFYSHFKLALAPGGAHGRKGAMLGAGS
jgi:hypothetical protein